MKIVIIILAVSVSLVFGLIISSYKECKNKGGIPVGYYGLDCWDNINKTFIR